MVFQDLQALSVLLVTRRGLYFVCRNLRIEWNFVFKFAGPSSFILLTLTHFHLPMNGWNLQIWLWAYPICLWINFGKLQQLLLSFGECVSLWSLPSAAFGSCLRSLLLILFWRKKKKTKKKIVLYFCHLNWILCN